MAEVTPHLALCASIGECLNAWTRVEGELSTLFMVIHGQPWSDFTHPLRAAFESVIAFEARLNMVRASVAADDSLTEYRPHANALYNKLLRGNKKRHEIAHFAMFGAAGKDGPIIGIKPFFTWANLTNNTGRAPLFLKEIKERTWAFNRLSSTVQQHCQHVGGLKGLPAEYFAQAGDLARPPLGKADLTPEEPSPPPQS
jgi:hypothetical protein